MTNPTFTKTTPVSAPVTTEHADSTSNEPIAVPQPVNSNGLEKRYQSRALFRGKQEIIIEHSGYTYRLRITRQDKLILTK